MIDQTVFAKTRPVDVRLKPFPHMVIEEALARDHYVNTLVLEVKMSG